jgi:uncharacterized protein DUF6600/FecR-like protein
MNRIKLWPHATIIALAVAVIAGLGVWFYAKYEQSVAAEALPYAARIQRVEGEVAYCDDRANNDANVQWTAATANQPFSEGDRIYTRDNARASLAFSGRNFARLEPNTSLDMVSFGNRRTQLALRDGSAMFDVGYLESNEVFEVGTPNGAIEFVQPGLYNVGFDRNGSVLVSVLSGLARVVGAAGSGEINKGEMLTLLGQTAAELALSKLNRQDAGYLVDDYYRYQYPNYYDGRYVNYDAYLDDPYYYDPYRRSVSYRYASANIPGLYDLDYYGDWQNVGSYGYAWRPRVDAGWMPYQQGQWISSYPYGPTWVSSEPWGYAPYHYGRWANVNNQWYWIPDGVNTTPTYAPALVAFVSPDGNQVGWVPLGPGDPYAPRYYDDNWQPHYLTRINVVPTQLVNFAVPGAVTVVPVDAWGRPIDRHSLQRIDQQRLAAVRSTLDPLTLTPLRNAVIHSAWGRGKIDLPPGIAKKLYDTRVFVSNDIRESKFRKDRAKWLRVEPVSGVARNQKFKIRDERQLERQAEFNRQPGLDKSGKHDMGRVTAEARKDNKAGEQQTRQLEQQQRKAARDQEKAVRVQQPVQQKSGRVQERVQEKAQRKAQPQPQAERVGKPVKSEAKPQTMGAPKERKPPAAPAAKSQGGGKGKGKKP